MLDIKHMRENTELVVAGLKRRGIADAEKQVQSLLQHDEKRRELLQKQELLNRKRNEIADAMKGGKPSDDLIQQGSSIKVDVKNTTEELETAQAEFEGAFRMLPNIPLDDVPDGGEKDFEIVAESEHKKPEGDLKDYLTLLGTNIDLERGAKVSGSRFVYITGKLARLEIALISFIFDQLAEHGFTPVMPPALVKESSMAGMGYFDQGSDEIYKTQDDLYLIGTSEQSIGPMHANETLSLESMPIRYVGYSSCFRREAGSHGKDVKGILRLHQFEKVEMFSFATSEKSSEEHEFLLARQRDIMDALELPYRVIKLAAGDLGAPSAKTYDIETWIPSEATYRETHSTSNTTDFQARRLGVRYRTDNGNETAHMLNGTAVALSRILIALIENHQQPDGTVAIPSALHAYLPFTTL